MDKKTTRPSHSQDEDEEWTSMPASAPRNNTPEALAQTEDSPQPPDYFHESKRTTSPPPVALEKAMDPSQASQPDTSTASTASCLSRSSTLNSYSTTQTQESDITLYSQSSSSSDETISVPSLRSLTFPAMRSYPVDRKSLPKGASIRVFEFPQSFFEPPPVFPYQSGDSFQMNQSTPGHINRYYGWSDGQDEGSPADPNQAPPSRHLTFPIERSMNPGKPDDAHSSMREEDGDSTFSGSFNIVNPLQKLARASDTDMDYTVFKQEMPPDEAVFEPLTTHTDVFVKSRLTSSERWALALLLSKQAGLHCERAPNTSVLSQRCKNSPSNRPLSKTTEELERGANLSPQPSHVDAEQPSGPGSTAFSTSTFATSVPTAEPEEFSTNELRTQTQTEETQGSHSSSQSVLNDMSVEGNPESSSQDSDDDTSFPHEEYSPGNEEDEDLTYDMLVESITYLVLESSCVGNLDERGVPVELYVHNFLEQVMNHPKPATEKQNFCLPIRSNSMPKQDACSPGDADEPDMHACSREGIGGSSGGSKRKSGEYSGRNHSQDHGDEKQLGDDLEETQGENPQGAKKLKTGQNGVKLSCPFRKRNPIRFNVRNSANCALNSFTDFALLKRHIKTAHQRGKGSSSCVRCKRQFQDQAALRYHLTRPDICPLRDLSGDEDPEDGITEDVERALKERAKGNNVRSWESLWGLLFPQDPPERIPSSEHEPPVELDEVQESCYNGDTIREFVQRQLMDGRVGIELGFWYIAERLWRCREKQSHKPSKERDRRDDQFKNKVRNELSMPGYASQAQQTRPMAPFDPPQEPTTNQWSQDLSDLIAFENEPDGFNSEISSFPPYAGYPNPSGFDGSQVPADPTLYSSSEHAAQHADPQNPATAYPYTTMLAQNASPCSAAGGSAHRSSRPSSHSRDSGDRTTQDTQDTQYTQDAALLLLHHPHHHPDGPSPCCCDGGGGGRCSCSTSPGGIPGGLHSSTMPGQGSSEQNLYGIGTSLAMRKEYPDGGAHGDEDFNSFPDMQ